MKKILIICIILLSSTSQAMERVNCHDEKNQWIVEYKLEGSSIIDLTFIYNSEVFRNYPGTLISQVSYFLGKTYFETSLGQFAYFDFERRKQSSRFSGEFLLKNNPLGFETSVSCIATEI